MQKWEYFLFCSEVCVKPSAMFQMEESDARRIWANHPNSDLAKIEEHGKQGWELIAVTRLSHPLQQKAVLAAQPGKFCFHSSVQLNKNLMLA